MNGTIVIPSKLGAIFEFIYIFIPSNVVETHTNPLYNVIKTYIRY